MKKTFTLLRHVPQVEKKTYPVVRLFDKERVVVNLKNPFEPGRAVLKLLRLKDGRLS